ncbi:MAG: phosphodiester glycosidase family protein [Eubacteriales bacterium]|nr:phosphodiester glycosidase family protein [Eubacteriales bacterium]
MQKKRLIGILAVLTFLIANTGVTAYAWETPCVSEPYGWQYQDDSRSIVISQVTENDITYFVADVQLAATTDFKTLVTQSGMAVSSLATQANAVLAINGDDCGTHQYGIIIRNGQLIRANETTRNLLILDADGDMTVRVDRAGENYQELSKQMIAANVWQSFEFGPELIRDGAAVEFSPTFDVISTRSTRLEPRTAIGQIGPLHYIVIVVDGRQDGYSVGISLQDLQQLFIKYGAETAMNLDGGGSAEMWFQGEILNRPSGGVERAVSDILYF